MAPKPPALGSAPAQPGPSSITVVARPRNGPQTPSARKRPGAAGALLDYRRRAAPKWPPNPQRSEAPRRSRGPPRLPAARGPAAAPTPRATASAPPEAGPSAAPRGAGTPTHAPTHRSP